MFWERTIPPTRRLRLVEATNVIINVRAPRQFECYILLMVFPHREHLYKAKT